MFVPSSFSDYRVSSKDWTVIFYQEYLSSHTRDFREYLHSYYETTKQLLLHQVVPTAFSTAWLRKIARKFQRHSTQSGKIYLRFLDLFRSNSFWKKEIKEKKEGIA